MLTIRDEQLEVLEAPMVERLERRMSEHLRIFFPEQCRILGQSSLTEAVRYGHQRAKRHGFSRMRDLCKYLDLMFTFGRDFDTRPDLAWAAQILSLNSRPATRMDRLLGRALEIADNGEGLMAERGERAEEPVLLLRQRRFDRREIEPWIDTMADLIRFYCRESRLLRWDDSADLEGMEHLDAITEVARRTPWTRHWLPTRADDILREYLESHPDGLPSNLLVRIGAADADTPAPRVAGIATSTVHMARAPMGVECRGPAPGGGCGGCRHCWNPKIANVSFSPDRWRSGAERSAA